MTNINDKLTCINNNTVTICPKYVNKSIQKYNNPCKLNQGVYTEDINYRNKGLSCHNSNNNNKIYGYYDLPCHKSAYKNTNYYNLNKNLYQFHESYTN